MGVIATTIKAAPIMLGVPGLDNDVAALQDSFNQFTFWGLYIRGALATLALLESGSSVSAPAARASFRWRVVSASQLSSSQRYTAATPPTSQCISSSGASADVFPSSRSIVESFRGEGDWDEYGWPRRPSTWPSDDAIAGRRSRSNNPSRRPWVRTCSMSCAGCACHCTRFVTRNKQGSAPSAPRRRYWCTGRIAIVVDQLTTVRLTHW